MKTINWLLWIIPGLIGIAAAVAFWPITLCALIVVGIIKYSAREFARENRRP